MKRSIFRPVSTDAVAKEYAKSAVGEEDHLKAKWGSHASMENRFRLALSVVAWDEVDTWLDVGCGPGSFFRYIEGEGYAFRQLVGVDLAGVMLTSARREAYQSPARFLHADWVAMPQHLNDFDLVTAVGVLQQCGYPPEDALPALLERVRSGGQLFLTTKHVGWKEFTCGKLMPFAGHSWFEYENLADVLQSSGASIVSSGGFLPRENKRVSLEESHTMFILARRNDS